MGEEWWLGGDLQVEQWGREGERVAFDWELTEVNWARVKVVWAEMALGLGWAIGCNWV